MSGALYCDPLTPPPPSPHPASQVKVIDPTKYRKIYEDIMKELDKYENDSLPQVSVDTTELIFDTVRFFETKTRTLAITNTGKVCGTCKLECPRISVFKREGTPKIR